MTLPPRWVAINANARRPGLAKRDPQRLDRLASASAKLSEVGSFASRPKQLPRESARSVSRPSMVQQRVLGFIIITAGLAPLAGFSAGAAKGSPQ